MTRWIAALALAASLTGCQAFERYAINGSIKSAFLEINTPGSGVTKLADDVYTFKWFGYRTGFVTTPEGVIVFDPLNAEAAGQLVKEIAKVAPNPTIRYVIYSHAHSDHTNGARALGGSPIILAHAQAAREIARRPDPETVPPTQTFDGDRHDLTLGGTKLELYNVPGAHTDGLVVVNIPHRKTLYVVDIVAVKMVPPFGSPFNSYHGVLEAMTRLQKIDFDTLIPGHGDYGTKKDLDAWVTLLRDMETALKDASAKEGMSPMRGNASAISDPHVGQVLFAATDALEPKYRDWQGWRYNSLQALQWVFLYGLYMNE